MLINNFQVDLSKKDYNIKCYNISCPNFDIDGIRKIKALIKRECNFIQTTSHFINKKQNYKIRMASLNKILAYGRCFEYKLLDDKYIYRMAIRVSEKNIDTVYVIEPIYTNSGIFVKFVTIYTVNHGDYHLIKKYSIDK